MPTGQVSDPDREGGGGVRRGVTRELGAALRDRIKSLLLTAFGPSFSEEDWAHALGGIHFWIEHEGRPVSHAAVVEREIVLGDRALRTGYVEAVATEPALRRHGLAGRILKDVTEHITERYDLGALSTGEHALYEQLGWERWTGPTFVRTPDGKERTAAEDGGVMILRTPRTPDLDPTGEIVCDWRPGDVW